MVRVTINEILPWQVYAASFEDADETVLGFHMHDSLFRRLGAWAEVAYPDKEYIHHPGTDYARIGSQQIRKDDFVYYLLDDGFALLLENGPRTVRKVGQALSMTLHPMLALPRIRVRYSQSKPLHVDVETNVLIASIRDQIVDRPIPIYGDANAY